MTDDTFGEVIYSYTRKQAIEDGVLVEAPADLCKEAGIKFPVAFTSALWGKWIEPSESDKEDGQSVTGRLWDVLSVFRYAARRCGGDTMTFIVSFWKDGKTQDVELKSVCGPGDNMEPVITVMLMDED